MKRFLLPWLLIIGGCQLMERPTYDVSGYSHTDQPAHVRAIFDEKSGHSVSMSGHRSSGLQIEVVPGIPSQATIHMTRTVGFSEPIPPGSSRPATRVIKMHGGVPDVVIDNRPISHVSNEYHHTIDIPPPPPLYGNTRMVAMFHAYTCHVEVDLDPRYFDESIVPPDEVKNDWTYKRANGKFRHRKPRYHPECPPFDGGVYEIDLNGGYKKIKHRGVTRGDGKGGYVTIRDVKDLDPALVTLPDK